MCFPVVTFSALWAHWEPKGTKQGGFGRSFWGHFGAGANMRESMFYVGASSIEQVWQGPGMVKFRGVFRRGSKVRSWGALLEIFVIFGCPWGSRLVSFSAKKSILRGSENSTIF